MTNIALEKVAYQSEKRGWLWGEHGTEPGCNPSISLDFAAGSNVAATKYTNWYVPSGTVLGKITATGKYGAYDPAAADGRQKAAGLLFGSVKVPASTSTVVGAALFVHGFVNPKRLPFQTGVGSADAAAQTALNLIYWL